MKSCSVLGYLDFHWGFACVACIICFGGAGHRSYRGRRVSSRVLRIFEPLSEWRCRHDAASLLPARPTAELIFQSSSRLNCGRLFYLFGWMERPEIFFARRFHCKGIRGGVPFIRYTITTRKAPSAWNNIRILAWRVGHFTSILFLHLINNFYFFPPFSCLFSQIAFRLL